MSALSPWVQKLVAIGLLFFAVALLCSVFLLPLLRWSSSSVERLHDVRFELTRANQILAASKTVSAQKIAEMEQLVSTQLVPGNTEAEATTQLQSLVDRLLKEQGLALQSIQAASPRPAGALTRLALDLRANATEQKVIHFVAAIEQSMPLLRIERFVLRGGNASVSESTNADSQVLVEATITAYWRSNPAGTGP